MKRRGSWSRFGLVMYLSGLLAACAGDGATPGADAPQGFDPDAFPGLGMVPDPAGFTATATGETSVALSWQAVVGALGYLVERRSGSAEYAAIASPTETRFTDETVARDTEYGYRLRAYGLAGISAGVERTVRTLGGTGPVGGGSSFDLIDTARASGAGRHHPGTQHRDLDR